MRRITVVALATVMIGGLGACGNGDNGGGPTPTATTTTPASPSATATASVSPSQSSPAPTGSVSAWTSGPLTVTKSVPVPPVPRLTGIRSAAHSTEGYDRITFDFVSTLPGYSVRYVDTVVADPSGQPVTVPGRRFLQIVFIPAQAHDDSGNPVTPRAQTLNYPMMKAYAITGDFEGHLTVTIGLDDVVGYRVGELPGTPGRIYLDVAA